jgi:hypothetical protein
MRKSLCYKEILAYRGSVSQRKALRTVILPDGGYKNYGYKGGSSRMLSEALHV